MAFDCNLQPMQRRFRLAAIGKVHQNGMEYSVDQQTSSTNWVPTTHHYYEAPTAPKTERCNAAILAATSSNASISSALTQVLGSKASKLRAESQDEEHEHRPVIAVTACKLVSALLSLCEYRYEIIDSCRFRIG